MGKEVEKNPRETNVSKSFANVLAILSIIGFVSILTKSLLGFSMDDYVETFWLTVLGIGFMLESNPKRIFHSIRNKLEERNFTAITTLIIGFLAIVSGIFSLPQIAIQTSVFLAVKGIMSIVAVIFIVVQTWVVE